MANNEISDYTSIENGAIPTLEDEAVLGEPTSRTKSKTNAGKLMYLGLVLLGFLFVIIGLLVWQKNRSHAAPTAPKAELQKPEHERKNEVVDSASIARTKAELLEKEAADKAAQKSMEDEALKLAAAQEEEARQQAARAGNRSVQPGPGSSPGPGPAAGGAGHSGGQPAPVEPTPRDRKMSGGVLLASTGAKIKPEQQMSEKDQQQREVDARMNAMGIKQGQQGAQNGAGGFFGGGAGSGGGEAESGGQKGGETLAGRLQSTPLAARFAGKLPNLNYLLKKGTSVPCALNTGINTTLPGFVTCKALNDVYSANGKTLLVERGATFFGEQQSAIKEGQERTFVLWTRVDNPSGIFANIDSPATDQMGYSGIPGYVETYFWKRFGGAIMLSLIKDFSNAYSQRLAQQNNSGNNNSMNSNPYQATQQAGNDMAGIALRNTINIPSTLLVLPGTVVNVMVARDVSFENVFTLID